MDRVFSPGSENVDTRIDTSQINKNLTSVGLCKRPTAVRNVVINRNETLSI